MLKHPLIIPHIPMFVKALKLYRIIQICIANVLFLLMLVIGQQVNGQTSTFTSTGNNTNWNNQNAWNCVGPCGANVPKVDGYPYDQVIIEDEIILPGGTQVLGSSSITINNGGKFSVGGNLFIRPWGTATLSVNNGGTLTTTGTLTLNAGASVNAQGTIDANAITVVGNNSELIMNVPVNTNNFHIKDNAAATNKTSLTVTDLLIENSAVFTNYAPLTVNGDIRFTGGEATKQFTNTSIINAENIFLEVATIMESTAGEINVANDFVTGTASASFESSNTTITVGNDFDITGSSGATISSDFLDVGRDFNYDGGTNTTINADMLVNRDFNVQSGATLRLGGDVDVLNSMVHDGGAILELNGVLDIQNTYSSDGSSAVRGSGIFGWGTFNNCLGMSCGATVTCVGGTIYANEQPPFNPLDLNICGEALPVTFVSLSTTSTTDGVLVEWATAMEENNDFFTIERSVDGINFEAIGQTSGAGNSRELIHYTFADTDPLSGVTYYRIRQTDFDGQYDYSNVTFVSTAVEMSLFPNPAISGGPITITAGLHQKEELLLTVIDMNGRTLLEENFIFSENNSQTVNHRLVPGVYIVKLTGHAESQQQKLIVQ